MNLLKKKEPVVRWGVSKQELTKDQRKAFQWLINIMKKKKEDYTDHEKMIQEIYTNVIIFSEE